MYIDKLAVKQKFQKVFTHISESSFIINAIFEKMNTKEGERYAGFNGTCKKKETSGVGRII